MEAKSTVSMKLLIDTKTKRVLFAEAGKEFVDFLFHILSLPLATVISLLRPQGMEGSLPNLYQSLENLDDTYILSDKNKDSFLKPMPLVSSFSLIPLLPLNDADIAHDGKNYNCSSPIIPHTKRTKNYNKEMYKKGACRPRPPSPLVPPPSVQVDSSGCRGIVKEVVTYMVMDDLVVKPMSTISSIALLNKFNVKDVAALEEKEVTFGINQALKLLKASLQSKNVLTDVFY